MSLHEGAMFSFVRKWDVFQLPVEGNSAPSLPRRTGSRTRPVSVSLSQAIIEWAALCYDAQFQMIY